MDTTDIAEAPNPVVSGLHVTVAGVVSYSAVCRHRLVRLHALDPDNRLRSCATLRGFSALGKGAATVFVRKLASGALTATANVSCGYKKSFTNGPLGTCMTCRRANHGGACSEACTLEDTPCATLTLL